MDTISIIFSALGFILQGVFYGALVIVGLKFAASVRATHDRAARYAGKLPRNHGHIDTRR